MAGKSDHSTQAAAIARATDASHDAPAILEHVQAILLSPAFRGSKRSQEFLNYIVKHALAGEFDQLKERTIGVELFNRPSTYDTAEDSIVRVSASDVRRRLLQFYAESGKDSDLRLELPAGSYIPEFRRLTVAEPPAAPPPPVNHEIAAAPPAETIPAHPPRSSWGQLAWMLALVFAAVAGYFAYQSHQLRDTVQLNAIEPPPSALPWTAILQKDKRVNVIVADGAFGLIQDLIDRRVTLPEYANRKYPPPGMVLDPNTEAATNLLLRRQQTAIQDLSLSVRISELAHAAGLKIAPRSARTLFLQDFKTDDNFILFGSTATNPWVNLFENQMRFVLEYDPGSKKMMCRDKSPESGDSKKFVPTASSFDTGNAYATITFLQNPGQSGYVLLVAGTSGEGTEVAGRFVTNPEAMAKELKKAGIDPKGPPRPFQVLLKLNVMAGAPSGYEVLTVHAPSETSTK